MNLFDNIAFPLVKHTKKSDEEIREIVMAKSDLVGLNAHLAKLPSEVSGGMRKRAGLARALALDPHILFFDEPDSGLDPVRVAYLDDLVNTVQEETGATFFIITHNIESVRRTADYFGVLFRSKLVAFGSKDELSNAGIPIVDQFLAGRMDGPISMDEMADAEVPPAESGAATPAAGASAPVARPVEDEMPTGEVPVVPPAPRLPSGQPAPIGDTSWSWAAPANGSETPNGSGTHPTNDPAGAPDHTDPTPRP
jgi:phospholipid/cholesterol/gamma-HCH transport system ATP-binding protein